MDDVAIPAFAFPSGVVAREVDGEMVLLNLSSEQYYSLDSVGANVVTRLTRESMDEALAGLRSDYDVDAEVLKQDVDELVEDLVQAGLLERPQSR